MFQTKASKTSSHDQMLLKGEGIVGCSFWQRNEDLFDEKWDI